jgi:hypothetical protein
MGQRVRNTKYIQLTCAKHRGVALGHETRQRPEKLALCGGFVICMCTENSLVGWLVELRQYTAKW